MAKKEQANSAVPYIQRAAEDEYVLAPPPTDTAIAPAHPVAAPAGS